jgi:hypothetical protein
MNFKKRYFVSIFFIALLACAFLVNQPIAYAVDGDICATVKIKFKQVGSPEGRGFRGDLVVSNGLTHLDAKEFNFQESFTFDGTSAMESLAIQGSGSGQFHFRGKRQKNPKNLVNGRARIDFSATIDDSLQPQNIAGQGRLKLRGRLAENNGSCLKGMLKIRSE